MKLAFFPASSRTVEERRVILEVEKTADYCQFGYDYFDNPHLGYGGYRYDGRYADVASAMVDHYGLGQGDRVLEIGCAKGYVLVEFYKLGMEVSGIDVSAYAVQHAHVDVHEHVQIGDACELVFEDDTFDLVFGKEVLPHIPEPQVRQAVRECVRVSKGPVFFEIQCGRTVLELEYMRRWDVTHATLRTPDGWDSLFQEVGFDGDVHYKVLISED